MPLAAWITAAALVVLVVILVRELATPSYALLGAVVTLVLVGAADPAVAFSGFSSTATITVAALFVVAEALRRHAGLDGLLSRLLRGVSSERRMLLRLCAPVAATSTVIANTPLVAGLAPIVRTWADRVGVPASRLLMPLSFATIIGGIATTIGTSTTLVASGVVSAGGGEPFGFLEVTPLGLPFAVLGTIVLVLLAPRLLPEREGSVLRPLDRKYAFRMLVVPGGPLDGETLEDAGLRHLEEVFVAAIDQRDVDEGPVPARPDARLAGGDVLVVVGGVDHVRDLPIEGLQPADEQHVAGLEDTAVGLHEAVLGPNSPLVGRTLKGLSFRGRYDAAVLAINRADHRLQGKLGTITLEAGDALLLQANPGFADRWRDEPEFALVAALDEVADGGTERRWFVLAVTAAMVLVAALGLLPLVTAVLWAAALFVVSQSLTLRQALDSLDFDVLLIIAAAIGLGGVVDASGLAGAIADGIGGIALGAGALLALIALLVGTTVLTEVVTNVASAALMVPIAMRIAEVVDQDPRGWAIATALTASTSFLTPIGYQTNTIVYGLGGYRFGDYWRLGLPLVVLWVVMAAVLVPLIW